MRGNGLSDENAGPEPGQIWLIETPVTNDLSALDKGALRRADEERQLALRDGAPQTYHCLPAPSARLPRPPRRQSRRRRIGFQVVPAA